MQFHAAELTVVADDGTVVTTTMEPWSEGGEFGLGWNADDTTHHALSSRPLACAAVAWTIQGTTSGGSPRYRDARVVAAQAATAAVDPFRPGDSYLHSSA